MSMSVHLDVQGLDPELCRMVPHGTPLVFTSVELAADGMRVVLYVGRDNVPGARALAALLVTAADDVEAAWAQRVPR